MGEIVHFRSRSVAVGASSGSPDYCDPMGPDDDFDEALLVEASRAARAAADRYERERRHERELLARIEALTRENARLKAELEAMDD
jgi:hypothetical protein